MGTSTPLEKCYQLRCGTGSDSNCQEQPYCAPPTEQHEVRCCADKEVSGWTKKAQCSVWGASNIQNGECVHAATFQEATDICKKAGGRLCTQKEVDDQCPAGTGCSHDSDLIWTSTPKKPLAECYELRCGTGSDSNCQEQPYCAPPTEQHEVRCCADKEVSGWTKKAQCSVWGASNIQNGECVHAATYVEATDICKKA